jgi:hypothetical protein
MTLRPFLTENIEKASQKEGGKTIGNYLEKQWKIIRKHFES